MTAEIAVTLAPLKTQEVHARCSFHVVVAVAVVAAVTVKASSRTEALPPLGDRASCVLVEGSDARMQDI